MASSLGRDQLLKLVTLVQFQLSALVQYIFEINTSKLSLTFFVIEEIIKTINNFLVIISVKMMRLF